MNKFLLIIFIFISFNTFAKEKEKVDIPLDRKEKSVSLFKNKQGETLWDISGESINKFIKNFDHRKEDEISLLWLKFPLEILALFFQSFLLLGALLSFISAKREEKEKNFFKEKDTFRKLWHDIYVIKKDIMYYEFDNIPNVSGTQKLRLKADADQLLDLLDDIYHHEKSIFNVTWRSWERDFEKVFSKPLFQTIFLNTKDSSFDKGFKKYALKLIKKFSDVEVMQEFNETIEEAEDDIVEEIEELQGSIDKDKEDSKE